jgi:hypothetical protein
MQSRQKGPCAQREIRGSCAPSMQMGHSPTSLPTSFSSSRALLSSDSPAPDARFRDLNIALACCSLTYEKGSVVALGTPKRTSAHEKWYSRKGERADHSATAASFTPVSGPGSQHGQDAVRKQSLEKSSLHVIWDLTGQHISSTVSALSGHGSSTAPRDQRQLRVDAHLPQPHQQHLHTTYRSS